MTSRRLPPLSRAQLEAIERRLRLTNINLSAQQLILNSLNAASNPFAETVNGGIQSLSPTQRATVMQIITQIAPSFAETPEEADSPEEEIDQAIEEAERDGLTAITIGIILALLSRYLMTDTQSDSLYETILAAYVASYQNGMRDSAARYGCIGAIVPYPSADIGQLQQWAREDTNSIRDTYNADAEKELRKLHASNPLAPSSYYLTEMSAWRARRQDYKARQISLNTVQKGYGYALQQFHVNNKLETKYRLTGVPPVCPICIDLFGRGHVDYSIVEQYPMPIHINCPHSWEPVNVYSIDCSTIWLG